jgi:UDP-N-acetylmuramate--alanine ligase
VFELKIPGRHNVSNAVAAVAVGIELGVGFGHIAEALAGFRGVSRRFELRGERAGVRVIDDYGHHPTEVEATLSAARGMGGRVLVIFQPHRYSRTALLREEFGAAFREADRVWVLEVYAAGESPIEGASGRSIVESAARQGFEHLEFAASGVAAVEAAVAEARPGDLVLTLGAGDVWKLGDQVMKRLAEPSRVAGGKS